MASATKKTRNNRKVKRAKQGKKRKAALRNQGSTKTSSQLFGDE